MIDFEKIEGQRVIDIVHYLFSEKTLVKVSLRDKEFDHLTVITNLRNESNERTFQIDPPAGLYALIKQSAPRELDFEFTGSDQLPHKFSAQLQHAGQKEIWLSYPAFIQRHQLRNNFRIKVPTEAQLQVLVGQTDVRMIIDNISLGGAFCHCSNGYKPLFEEKQQLNKLEMMFTLSDHCIEVPIERAVVRRLEPRTRPKHFGVALEFVQISNEARKKLTQEIYDIQRYYLQSRRKTLR